MTKGDEPMGAGPAASVFGGLFALLLSILGAPVWAAIGLGVVFGTVLWASER